MSTRRDFLKTGALAAAAPAALAAACATPSPEAARGEPVRPLVVSTWNMGLGANEAAWEVLSKGGRALDAVEAGVRVPEGDPNEMTVGLGGYPDRDGIVTLDACIMDENGRCGSVAALEGIVHPISVARLVMERTPHVMLVGKGAQDFAVANGFEIENLLTPAAEAHWRRWLEEQGSQRPPINVENHDTCGMLAIDQAGNLSGACTTSGAGMKYHGRVGDSPIIGAGLYVDNEVGGATSTGWGEAVIRAVGCFLVVELMRQGHSPAKACELAVDRVIAKNPDWRDIQVGFLAVNRQGEVGAFCIAPGFNYALRTPEVENRMFDAPSRI